MGLNGPKDFGSEKWKKTRFSAAKQRMPVSAGSEVLREEETGLAKTGAGGTGGAGVSRTGADIAGGCNAIVLSGVRRSPGNRPSLHSRLAECFQDDSY